MMIPRTILEGVFHTLLINTVFRWSRKSRKNFSLESIAFQRKNLHYVQVNFFMEDLACMRRRYVYYCFGFIVVIAFWYLPFSAGTPTWYAPWGLSMLFPIALSLIIPSTAFLSLFGFFLLPLLYFPWGLPILSGKKSIPQYSLWLSTIIMTLSIVWILSNIELGNRFRGIHFTRMMLILHGLFAVILFSLAWWNRRDTEYWQNYVFHLLFFIWLVWLSFPWMGELI